MSERGTVEADDLKRRVHDHWADETCGTRGLSGEDRKAFFDELENQRYHRYEPFIPEFARWERGRNREVLEIGVGAGTDHIQWARAGARLHGIDLTQEAIDLTAERLALEGFTSDLRVADAESLPFEDGAFDVVYSYGVLHHSPDTERSLAEVHRVLRPGGTALIMLYNLRSWTAWNLWALHCLARGRPWKTPRWAVYNHLESPGTKAYTRKEVRELMNAFEITRLESKLLGGDLLAMPPSRKYQTGMYRLIFRFYPAWLVRLSGHRFGFAWLIEATR
jgi:ubiquinone/menaquinone biosynthesis C-methylase UbiE